MAVSFLDPCGVHRKTLREHVGEITVDVISLLERQTQMAHVRKFRLGRLHPFGPVADRVEPESTTGRQRYGSPVVEPALPKCADPVDREEVDRRRPVRITINPTEGGRPRAVLFGRPGHNRRRPTRTGARRDPQATSGCRRARRGRTPSPRTCARSSRPTGPEFDRPIPIKS